MQPTEGSPPEPPLLSSTGHPLPRRTSGQNSITLRHHQLARDASLKASRGSVPPNQSNDEHSSSPRRNSSGDSNETGQSDAKKWFNQSNQNPTAIFDSNSMDGKYQVVCLKPPYFESLMLAQSIHRSFKKNRIRPMKTSRISIQQPSLQCSTPLAAAAPMTIEA